MKWSIANKINTGFGLSLAFLVIVGIVSYRSTSRLVETIHWALHAHNVLDELDDILFHIKNAETGQRGFIVTGEEHYLEPYQVGIMNIDRELKFIRKLTEDGHNHQRWLDTLEVMIAEKFSNLRR